MFITPPIVAFNTKIAQISSELEEIVFNSEVRRNTPLILNKNTFLIFENENIYFFDFLRIKLINNEVTFQFMKPLNKQSLIIVNNMYNNFDRIVRLYLQYYAMYLNIGGKMVSTIPASLLLQISEDITHERYTTPQTFILPLKPIVAETLSPEFGDMFLKNKTFLIELKSTQTVNFDYNLYIAHDSGLDENKYYDERWYDKDLIKSNKINKRQVSDFIINLFCYGVLL